MSDSGEKQHGFQRWVASLKLENLPRSGSSDEEPISDLDNFDEQATLVKRLPKEVIYRLRERESNRVPQSDESTAIFVPPPELLVRAKRLDAPPKPPLSVPAPQGMASLENEPTRVVQSDPMVPRPNVPSTLMRDSSPPSTIDGPSPVEEEPTRMFSSDKPSQELVETERPGPPDGATAPVAFPAFENPGDAAALAEELLAPNLPEQAARRAPESLAPEPSGLGWLAFAVALLVLAVLLVTVVR